MLPQPVSAARTLVYVDGRLFGIATSFSWTSSTPVKALGGIDDPMDTELAITRVSVRGECGCYRFAGTGGLEGSGLTAQFSDITRQKYTSIAIKDRATDQILFQADNCMIEAQSWQVAARGLMQGTFSFRGISWWNEAVQNGIPSTGGLG